MTAPNAASPVCAIIRHSLGDYLRESLPAPQRSMLRDHLAACLDCRAAAVASDPTFRFARPLPQEVPADESLEILAAVRTGVDLLQAQRRLGSRARRVRLSASSAAAAAVAAAILLSSGWGILRSRSLPAPATGVAAAAPQRLSPIPQPASEAAEAGGALQPAGRAEAVSSPSDATVYDWNPGAGREEPRVVWIVDRGLDI